MKAKFKTVVEVNKIAAIEALTEGKAKVLIQPGFDGEIEVLINNIHFENFILYTDACSYVTSLANDGLSFEQEKLLSKHKELVVDTGKNDSLFTLEEISPYIDEMKNQEGCFSYIALVCFDMSKRKINRSDNKHFFIITGDNFEDALAEFKIRDESYGLVESEHSNDFGGDVMTVVLECEA